MQVTRSLPAGGCSIAQSRVTSGILFEARAIAVTRSGSNTQCCDRLPPQTLVLDLWDMCSGGPDMFVGSAKLLLSDIPMPALDADGGMGDHTILRTWLNIKEIQSVRPSRHRRPAY